MRRGHSSVGGWRSENPGSFRPFRGSGAPNYRPTRSYGPIDLPRYPPPGHQHYRGPRPYSQHPRRTDSVQQSEYNDRNKYRINNLPYSQNRGYHHRGRQLPPFNHQQRQNDNHSETNYYQNSNQCHVNSMGDHDFRRQHQINPWANPSPAFENNRQYYDDHRSPQKTPRHIDMGDDIPDYTGHRPPASDHYTTTTTGSNNNNSQYSHSVDDTVDIIRKRLQNRDKQQNSESSIEHQNNADEDVRKNIKESYQNMPQEQPVRKKTQRQKQNIKSNCDKMKNKIVHQLFKMDKTKIHKLMDNPSSSSKFEYAISSLITEGQNSLNRHLRSAAEKSLCSSSTDFMQDDSNTIYEDTFMKQMQGILDPQDTVLLEDMKPLVMAELSRVLQLDDYQFEQLQEHGIQIQGLQDYEMQNNEIQSFTNENEIYELDETAHSQYYDEIQLNEQYSQDTFYEHSQASGSNAEEITADGNDRFYDYDQDSTVETKPFFERRSATKQVTENAYDNAKVYDTEKVYNTEKIYDTEKRRSAESRRSRNSIEISFANERETQNISSSRESKEQAHSIPLFDPNTDQLSEDDDPFAELDKQYHVAVDHNFIKYASRPSSPSQSNVSNSDKSPHFGCNAGIEIPNITVTSYIKNEIEAQLQDFVQLPIKYEPVSASTKDIADVHPTKEPEQVVEKQNLLAAPCKHVEIYSSPQEANTKKGVKKKHESTTPSKFVLQSNTRKRLTDQQPSHRKEKLKRSSQSECHEPAVMNMFFVHNPSKEVSKITNKPDSTSKTYSDKYVKRKATLRKYKVKEPSKTDNSNTSSHSMISPKDTASDTKPKSDKKKLKPIDIFESLTPKKTTIHLSHRNTAPVATTSQMVESSGDTKPKVPLKTSFARKLSKRHISTQVILKVKDNECQTEVQKQVKKITRKTQTEPVTIKSRDVSTNPLERMKEIDMEIQLLLQEKFKLYNSLETKAAEVPIDTIPSLSMRVFKVNTENIDEKSNDSEDAIVDDFTNIPTEELEQIAMETIIDQQPLTPSISTNRSRRQKVADLSRKSSASPTAKRINKRSKSPSISLIEEIITDNRPIEDIISLDDLETGPIKSKRKQKKQPKKKSAKKSKSSRVIFNTNAYSLKECSVVIKRIDISSYIKTKAPVLDKFTFKLPTENSVPETEDNFTSEKIEQEIIQDPGVTSMVNVVEDVNDLQFDMLDVSEDIVIGDNCEFKTIDKIKETITEEIILDNSQSSMEDGAPVSSSTENECKMYDYSNENLRRDAITVTGNADAVLAIECIDDAFIAACLDGNVYHFSGDGQLLNTLRGTNQAVTCLTIVKEKYGTTVYTGSLDSRMRYYDLETGMEKGPECNVLSPIQTMDRAWDTIFVGTRTGFVLQFECKNNMVIPVSTVKFSEQSILALRAMKEGPRKVLLVAARSENVVTVKDAQTGLLLRTLQGPKMSVYTLLYEDGKVYCGTSSHNIHVFDYTSGGHVGTHEGGKGAVCLRASGGLVFAGCYDGCVYVYREGEARALAQLRGPGVMLLSLAIHGTKIIAGYKDRGLYIWKMPLTIVQEMIL